jgi:hypothetical protein
MAAAVGEDNGDEEGRIRQHGCQISGGALDRAAAVRATEQAVPATEKK